MALGGSISVNGVAAQPGDGVAVTGELNLIIGAASAAEIVLVDAR